MKERHAGKTERIGQKESIGKKRRRKKKKLHEKVKRKGVEDRRDRRQGS